MFYQTESSSPFLINQLIAWDEIEIEDELSESNEKSNNTKSKLSVPLVCSASIQNILFHLSQELIKNLSYDIIDSNLILKDLTIELFAILLENYKEIITINATKTDEKIKLTQNQALQFLFDLKYVFNLFDIKSVLLAPKQETDDATIDPNKLLDDFKNVCTDLEALIDPFDYDICLPFLQSNVNKFVARSTVSLVFIHFVMKFSKYRKIIFPNK